jgi:hypothetical protein
MAANPHAAQRHGLRSTWRCRQTNFARQKCAGSAHSNTAEIVLSLTALSPVSTDLPKNVDPSVLI